MGAFLRTYKNLENTVMHNLKHEFCDFATLEEYGSWCPKIQSGSDATSPNASGRCSVEARGVERVNDTPV